MKASVKLRSEEQKPPLLRFKLPLTPLNLPLISSLSVAADLSSELSLGLRSATATSVGLLFRPHHSSSPFSLSLRSFYHHLQLTAALSLSPSPSPSAFFVDFKLSFGQFSIKKTGSKVDGFFEDLLSPSNLSVSTYTTLPVTGLSAVKIRWGFGFPSELPSQFRLNKISLEAVKSKKDDDEKNLVVNEE